MIQIKKITLKYILFSSIALFFCSCLKNESDDGISENSGEITTEIRNIDSDFSKIEASNAVNVVIEQSYKTEVIVNADKATQEEIITDVKNGTLYISIKNNTENKINFSIFKFIEDTKKHFGLKQVIVKLSKIESLNASSTSKIKTLGIITSNRINIKTSSAATMNLNVESDEIKIITSSASIVNINGMSLKLGVSSTSSSTVNASNLLTNEVIANASSASNISVHPIVNFKANATSGSSIEYNILPKKIEEDTSSGGSIEKI